MAAIDPDSTPIEPRSGQEARSGASDGLNAAGGAPPARSNTLSLIGRARWFVFSMVCVVGIILVVVAERKGMLLPVSPPSGSQPEVNSSDFSAAAIQEWKTARADHEAIAFAVAQCQKLGDLYSQPRFVIDHLLLGLMPSGDRGRYGYDNKDSSARPFQLTSFQRAAVYLSNAVARERIEAASDMNGHYSRMKHFQIAVTIIGAITTVLIGIKSMSNNNTTAYFIVGLLAMTFSSVGTAASALNAFYRPREAYNESQKNLSLLKQLHVEIAVAVNSAADGENCLKMTDKNDGTVKQWTKRLATILSSSGAAAQSEVKGPDENPQINSPAVPPTTTAGLQVEH